MRMWVDVLEQEYCEWGLFGQESLSDQISIASEVWVTGMVCVSVLGVRSSWEQKIQIQQ
jgi:hypothetical protein